MWQKGDIAGQKSSAACASESIFMWERVYYRPQSSRLFLILKSLYDLKPFPTYVYNKYAADD